MKIRDTAIASATIREQARQAYRDRRPIAANPYVGVQAETWREAYREAEAAGGHAHHEFPPARPATGPAPRRRFTRTGAGRRSRLALQEHARGTS